MKKFLLLLIPLCLIALLFLPENEEQVTAYLDTDIYYTNLEFNIVLLHEDSDTLFSRQVETVIDQTYDNFEIFLLINTEKKEVLSPIITYAKKNNKAHLLHIIHKSDELAASIATKDLIETLHKDSILLLMDKRCSLHKKDALAVLNDTYKSHPDVKAIIPSFINLPSYKQNKKNIPFEESSLKTLFVSSYLEQEPLQNNSLFLDTPLYMKTR